MVVLKVINGIKKLLWPDEYPEVRSLSWFDPQFGFDEPRKKKEMIATEIEMDSANLPLRLRDFCSHRLLDLMACHHANYPWRERKCWPEEVAWKDCEIREETDRSKDFERERRLMVRRKRIKQRKDEMMKQRQSETMTS